MNFSFANQNPFGDYGRANPQAFVDPNAIRNPDGSSTVFLMSQHGVIQSVSRRTGHIHSFTTTNYVQFKKDSLGNDTTLIDYDDFDAESVASYGGAMVHSLNDPKCVILPDGRYRIYSTALLRTGTDTTRWGIVSYTRPGPYVTGTHPELKEFSEQNSVFVTNRRVFIENRSGAKSAVVFDLSGKEVKSQMDLTSGLNSYPLDVPAGCYIVLLDSGESGRYKILVN